MRGRLLLAAGGLLAAVLAAAGAIYRPDHSLRVGTGAVAHDLCDAAFVQGLDPDTVYAESLAPRVGLRLLSPLRWVQPLLTYTVDHDAGEVTATLAGRFSQRAALRPGQGCLVLHAPVTASAAITDGGANGNDGAPAEGSPPIEPASPALAHALDRAFAEDAPSGPRRTKAVVVMRDGRIVAERYAPGYGPETKLLGFSMAKSVMNALVGVLVRQGRLDPAAPAPVAAWQGAGDPRRAITLEHLMRMTSGLDLDETGSGFDPSNRMFYVARDMAAFAWAAPLATAPGVRWNYSSAMTHVVARIVRDATGGTGEGVLAFARRELLEPLGAPGVVIELDATGTPIGAHYMLAPARDWARLGQLYLDDGIIGGRRLLPEGWVRWSTTPTLESDYGAGFWTNQGNHPFALGRVRRGVPEDAFFASGNLGQRLAIIPSHRLVIARFGYAHHDFGDIGGFIRLITDVIAAGR
jgi:CubicO group peptidase (beta-lactamase class C family)